jgi:hypothetical protein
MTELFDNFDDLMSVKVLKTIEKNMIYPENRCDLVFTPQFVDETLIYAVFIAFN